MRQIMCKINYDCLAFLALISLISNFSFPQYSIAVHSGDFLANQEKTREEVEIDTENLFTLQKISLVQSVNPIAQVNPIRKSGVLTSSFSFNNHCIPAHGRTELSNGVNKKAVEKTASEFKKSDKTVWVVATAYSSTVDQCDANPFITASGTKVHNGTLAANFLKFGTRVKFPALYGEKIFIVEDRMRAPARGKVDLWFPTRNDAITFGVKRIQMVILDF